MAKDLKLRALSVAAKEHMERTAEKHIREIYSEQELDQMDSIEEAVPWLDPGHVEPSP